MNREMEAGHRLFNGSAVNVKPVLETRKGEGILGNPRAFACLFAVAVAFTALLAAGQHENEPNLELLQAQFILFVADQAESATFYTEVLGKEPSLNVPGMTQFEIPGCTLGLMPAAGIKRLLGEKLPDPGEAAGVPRAELYLLVSDPEEFLERAVDAGATELSPVQERGRGDRAGYCLDPDGHVLAFAENIRRNEGK